ncbi:MAG: sugar transferase [Elusimicrobiota bacterium]
MRIRKSYYLILLSLVILEALALCLSMYLAYHTRFFSGFTSFYPITKGIPEWVIYKYTLLFIVPLWLFIFYENDFYKIFFLKPLDELIRTVRVVSISMFFTLLAIFFYREFSYSRLVFLFFCINATVLLFFIRIAMKLFVKYVSRSLIGSESVIVFGRNNHMLKAIFKQHPHFKVTYFPSDESDDIEKAKALSIEKDIAQIILTHHKWPENVLLKFYDWCENKQIALKFIPDIVHICRGEIAIDSSLGVPIFQLKPVSLSGFNFYFKRVVDLIISIIFLSLIWPVMLFIAIFIKLDSPGPILYNHKRMGYRGQTFNFYKFRTMVMDADKLLEKFKKQSERKGPVFKMSNDPRVTNIGRILRRFSIDEIPQMINVLRGEMSLVGPRPQVLWEAAAYDDWAKRRLRILPGITGLWQVSGRASLSYEEMIELDIYYIENWTMGMDVKILFSTLPAIFSKKGAY